MSLGICPRDFHRARHKRLDRVGKIVRLIKHVRRIEIRQFVNFRIDQLVKDQEKLERLNGAGIEIVVAVFAVIKVKAAEFAELNEARNDLLNIDVRGMMAEIDETRCFFAEFAGTIIAGAPIVNYGRIKRRLKEFVLNEKAPVIGDRGVDLAHRVKITLKRVAKI